MRAAETATAKGRFRSSATDPPSELQTRRPVAWTSGDLADLPASAALPPFLKISRPASAASGWEQATRPLAPIAGRWSAHRTSERFPELSDAPYTTERREWNGAHGTGLSVRWSWRWSDDFCFGVACGMAGFLCTEVVGECQDADPSSAAAAHSHRKVPTEPERKRRQPSQMCGDEKISGQHSLRQPDRPN